MATEPPPDGTIVVTEQDRFDRAVEEAARRYHEDACSYKRALVELVSAVEAHKRYWPRVDWGSEIAERAVFAALAKAKEIL